MQVDLEERKEDVEGVWMTFEEGVRFLIARAGNRRFLRASDKAESPYRKQIARGKLSNEKQLEIQCRAMAEGILLGWEGIRSADGPLEYSTEAAFKVLRYNSAVREFVFDAATEMENFRQETIDETAKKSQPISSGDADGQ